MAETRKSGKTYQDRPAGDKDLQQDELVESLLLGPAQMRDVRMLSGYLGKSAQDGYWRLYLNPELNEYVEFSAEDVVHSQRLEPSQSPLGGTVIWLRRGANLTHSRAQSGETQAEFLRGEISSLLPRIGATDIIGGPLRVQYPRTEQVICHLFTACSACPRPPI